MVVRLVTPLRVASENNGWQISNEDMGLMNEIEKEMINAADCVIPISNSIADIYAKMYGLTPDANWRINYPGIAYWPSHDVNHDYSDLIHMPSCPS